jgi:hypothetical protein
MHVSRKCRPVARWALGAALATTALVGLGGSTATAAPVPQAVGSRHPGTVPVKDSCTDWGINGWGDCGTFVSNCGAGGGHAHALNESGVFPSVTYTCHSGGTHRAGD